MAKIDTRPGLIKRAAGTVVAGPRVCLTDAGKVTTTTKTTTKTV